MESIKSWKLKILHSMVINHKNYSHRRSHEIQGSYVQIISVSDSGSIGQVCG